MELLNKLKEEMGELDVTQMKEVILHLREEIDAVEIEIEKQEADEQNADNMEWAKKVLSNPKRIALIKAKKQKHAMSSLSGPRQRLLNWRANNQQDTDGN